MASPNPRTFLSYTHDSLEHCEAVLAFAIFLRQHGIDVELDRWAGERQDWYAWALRNITEADFVIVVASEGYRRMGDGNGPGDRNLGGQAEAAALRELLQRDRGNWTRKLLPVVLPGRSIDEIPLFLQPRSADHFVVPAVTLEGTDDLLRHLTRQPLHIRPELGALPILPPRSPSPVPAAEQSGWRFSRTSQSPGVRRFLRGVTSHRDRSSKSTWSRLSRQPATACYCSSRSPPAWPHSAEPTDCSLRISP